MNTIKFWIDKNGPAISGVEHWEWWEAKKALKESEAPTGFWSVLGYLQAGTGNSPHSYIDHPNDDWKLAAWEAGYRVGIEKWLKDQGEDPATVLNFTQKELQSWLAARKAAGEKS